MRTLSLALVLLTSACFGPDCDREPIVDDVASEIPWDEELLICPGDERRLYDPATVARVRMQRLGLVAPEAVVIEKTSGDQRLSFGMNGKVEFDLHGFCEEEPAEPTSRNVDWLELSVDDGGAPARVVLTLRNATYCL